MWQRVTGGNADRISVAVQVLTSSRREEEFQQLHCKWWWGSWLPTMSHLAHGQLSLPLLVSGAAAPCCGEDPTAAAQPSFSDTS